MRASDSNGGLNALAVAGSYVVLIGWDMPEADLRSQSVLGFAIQRQRHEDGEKTWLRGMKTFESVERHPAPGDTVSSFRHPLQTFQWADYTVSPDKEYTYVVVAMCGAPGALKRGAQVSMTVRSEPVDQGRHAVFFNRGAVASQAYARRFQNRKPSEVGPAAYDWLSRGLVEGLERFIEQAGAGDELYGAFFEFKNRRVHEALLRAAAGGAAVSVLYDGDTQRESNEEAIQASGIGELVKPRMNSGRYAHNKFLVLRQGGRAMQVWTGSVNLSENGLFGHSNNAHLLRDETIATRYFEYWQVLHEDPTRKPTAQRAQALSPLPAPSDDAIDETVAIFSPRTTLDALDRYASLAAGTKRALFMTFAFGMNSRFVPSYDTADDVLRFALLEKKGNGKQFKQQSEQIDRIRRHPNVTLAVGHRVELNAFDRWLAEVDRIVNQAHVLYVHTKYMLVDPLGDSPLVVVGSANFSEASTDTNDENMLMIRGNSAVADIYLGEFMRLFSHYAFRESLRFKSAASPVAALVRKYLLPTASWIDGNGPGSGYFEPGTDRALRRAYFSQPLG